MQKPSPRRRTALFTTIAVATLAALLLSGCAPDAAKPANTSTPDAAAPLFASDEEALAAAEAAYAKYQQVSDEVFVSGGAETSGLVRVADGAALDQALQNAADLLNAGVTGSGTSKFVTWKAQALDYASQETTTLTLYVCDDVSATDLLNASGESIVKPGRVTKTPFEIAIGYVETKGLVLVEKNYWKGAEYCEGL